MCKELCQVTIPVLHRYVQLAKECNVVLKHFGFLPLLRRRCVLRICEEHQRILLDWVMRSSSTFLSQPWYCFLPVSSQVHTVANTDSSAQLQLSRVTSSGKSFKNGLPIRLMVSERLVTCLWKVICAERHALGAGNFQRFKVKIFNGTHRIIYALLLTY